MSWEHGIQQRRKTFPDINKEILEKEGYIEEHEAKILFYKFLRENPSFASELLTGVKLFPFQHMSIKAMMETDYFLGIWCLDENEYVLTQNGFKKIKDIEVGEYVRSKDGYNKVYDKKFNKPDEDGLKIKTNSGDSFSAKIGHKVLVYNELNLEFQFKEIQDLNIGDNIPVKIGTDSWGDSLLVNNTEKTKIIDEDYWYFLIGHFIGDGYFDDYTMHWCSMDNAIIDMTLETAKRYFPFNKILARARATNGFLEMGICNKDLINWLEDIGFDRSNKAKNKIIPDKLLGINGQKMAALISGIFSADGYCSILNDKRCIDSKNIKLGLKNTSYELLRQVKMLLNNFGVKSNLRQSGIHKDVPYYDLVVASESLALFSDKIGFISDHKQANLEEALKCNKKKYQRNLIPSLGQYLKGKYKSYEKLFGIRGNFGKDMSIDKALSAKNISLEDLELLKQIKNENIYFSKVLEISTIKTRSVDISVENEENYVGNGFVHHNSRGMSKSFSTAVYAILDATLHQGVHIGLISKSFRQAKMIFNKMEEISLSPKAELFAQAITRVSKSNDQWTMEIGRSKITALPLGDGEKLRGFRFQRMIIDELLLMPEKVLNEVIMPFLSVVENPTERQEIYDLETKLINTGKMKEEDRKQWPNNKIIGLSSASYRFEYLFKLYSQYESLILNKNDQDGAHRTIMHFSYDCAPDQLYDQNLINQAKATMSQAQFDREFGAIFTDDSSGYFKVSKMKECTIPDGEGQSVEVVGNPDDEYILSIDPSWSESESSDDFAMVLIKRDKSKPKGTIVHSYAMSGTNLKSHIIYLAYLLNYFNIVSIVADYNGGVQFINSCNESEIFKQLGIKLDIIDANFDDLQEYESGLRDARNQYNLQTRKIVYLRKPSSQWIRYANESLQSAFDHKNIYFAGAAMDDDYNMQRKSSIPIKDLKFIKNFDDNQPDGAKMIDFVEHQKDMMDLIKVECALIQVSTSTQGTQSFDLPHNLKKQRGADKARKDSYSALVLGNWMISIHFDMMNQKAQNIQSTFAPFLI
jgi:intein/homing endonuclease